eukprot:jgi/Orpsp1_1/1183702/evm.model.c7180000086344.2
MEFEGKIVNEIKNENRTSMNSLFFIPYDKEVPYFEIKYDNIKPSILSVQKFKRNFEFFRHNKYKARIFDWNSRFKNPLGELIECLSNNNSNSNNYGGSYNNSNRGIQRTQSKSSSESLTIHLNKDGQRTVDSTVNGKSLRNSKSRDLRNSKSRELRNSKSNSRLKSNSRTYYEKYISKEEVEKGLENKTLFKGELKFDDDYKSTNCYVLINNSDKIFIKSDVNRNRGLDGDEVVIVKNDDKTGKVVYIEKPSYKDKKINGKILYEVEKSGGERNLVLYLCP